MTSDHPTTSQGAFSSLILLQCCIELCQFLLSSLSQSDITLDLPIPVTSTLGNSSFVFWDILFHLLFTFPVVPLIIPFFFFFTSTPLKVGIPKAYFPLYLSVISVPLKVHSSNKYLSSILLSTRHCLSHSGYTNEQNRHIISYSHKTKYLCYHRYSKPSSPKYYGFSSSHVWMWEGDWLSTEELKLWNCDVGEDSWKSLGLQGDQSSQF